MFKTRLKYNSSYHFSQNNSKKKKYIYIKNFLYFFLLINYLKNLNLSIKTSFFFKKKHFKFKNILNSPNRHKSAQTKFLFVSYNFFFTLKIFFKTFLYFNNTDNVFYIFYVYKQFLTSFFFFFESYLISLNSKFFELCLSLNYKNLLK